MAVGSEAHGIQSGQPGPSTDVVGGTVRKYNAVADFLESMRVVTQRIDDMIQLIDSEQHAVLSAARDRLRAAYPSYKALSEYDPSYFHGRSVIYNRSTQRHRDIRDKKLAWTPVLTLGLYTEGWFHIAGYKIKYPPGTLALARGAALPHSAESTGGQRVCIAHFTHDNIFEDVDTGPLPLMSLTAVAAQLKKNREDAEQRSGRKTDKEQREKKEREKKEQETIGE